MAVLANGRQSIGDRAVVYRTIPDHLLSEARLSRRTGHTGAVTLIQRIAERLGRMLQRRGLIGPLRRRASIPVEPLRSGRAQFVAASRAYESNLRDALAGCFAYGRCSAQSLLPSGSRT